MYPVQLDGPAQEQVDALPVEALEAFADLRVALETAPWNGLPYRRDNPHGTVRILTFGGRGQAVFLILEDQRRVDVLMVQWVS